MIKDKKKKDLGFCARFSDGEREREREKWEKQNSHRNRVNRKFMDQ